MDEEALDALKVTAERVERFAGDVDADPGSREARALWRGALVDFRDALRRARAAGWDRESLQAAANRQSIGRFVRARAPERDPVQPRADG